MAKMNNQVAYSEMKIRAIINSIQKKLDKNQQDYWIIRTQLDQFTKRDYLAFSTDYNLSSKTKSFLANYPQQLVNNWAILTIKKKDEREKVIGIELEKN